MLGLERKPAAKEVDAVFSTAAMAETRGSGGEGGERRQRAMGIHNNRIDGRLGSGDRGSVCTRRRDQWRETTTTRPWRQQRMTSEEKDVADDAGRGRRGDGGEEAIRKQGKNAPVAWPLQRQKGNRGEGRGQGRWLQRRVGKQGTDELLKTEMKPTAMEKSEGRP